jgi:hypothetical protein
MTDAAPHPQRTGGDSAHHRQPDDRIADTEVRPLTEGLCPSQRPQLVVSESVIWLSVRWSNTLRSIAASGPGRAAELPLVGLRVVDASSFQAAPFAAELLASWGADVVKVEPPSGDPFGAYPMSVLVANQHKRSIALDLTTPAAQEVFRTLVARADVLIENFRRGRLSRMNIDPHELRRHDPRLVHCSVSAFGRSVSKQDTPAFDPVLQTLSGLADARPVHTVTELTVLN